MKNKYLALLLAGFLLFSGSMATASAGWSMTATKATNISVKAADSQVTNTNGWATPHSAVAKIGTDYYTSIEKAVEVANGKGTNTTVQVLQGANAHITRNLTIGSKVTLSLPFNSAGDIQNSSWDDITTTAFSDAVNDNLRQILVTVDDGITLTNNGTLSVGGTWGAKSAFPLSHVSGAYSEMRLGQGSSLINNGTLNCYGFIKETGLENGSIVEIGKNGTCNLPFVIYDFVSAGTTKTLINNGVFPFAQFDLPNIQNEFRIYSGGKIDTSIRLVVNGVSDEEQLKLVGNSSSYLFNLSSGYVTLRYLPKTLGRTSTSSASNGAAKTTVTINGNLSVSYINMSLSGIATIDTRVCPFPFTYRFVCRIASGTTTIPYPVKYMNGSSLEVAQNSSLVIGGSLLFYPGTFVDNRASRPYPSGYPAATFECNGTLTMQNGSSLGAEVTTTNTGNEGKLVFEAISSSNLSASMTDGSSGNITVARFATGLLVDSENPDDEPENQQFQAPGTYTSRSQAWSGAKIASSRQVSFTIKSITGDSLCQYSVETANSSSGSGAVTVYSKASDAQNFVVENGVYIRLTLNWGSSASVTLPSNYSGQAVGVWIKVTSDMSFEITPLSAIKLTLGYSGTGVNHTGIAFTLNYCQTQSGQYSVFNDMQDVQNSGSGTYLFPKDYYFKLVYNSSWTSKKSATFKVPTGGVVSGDASKHVNTNIYHAIGGTWDIRAAQDYNCLLPNTMVTMADGSKRAIKDICVGDTVLAFNHESGQLAAVPVVFNEKEEAAWQNVIHLEFDKGSRIGAISEHGFFDMDTLRYEYIDETNYADFVGHRFYCEDGTTSVLERAYITNEYTECYSLPTFYHLNFFAEGMLSMPGGIRGLFNIYEYGVDLKYDEEAYARDMAEYGLFEYGDLEPYGVTEEMFDAYGGKNLKVALGKGVLTEEYLAYLIERYGQYTD